MFRFKVSSKVYIVLGLIGLVYLSQTKDVSPLARASVKPVAVKSEAVSSTPSPVQPATSLAVQYVTASTLNVRSGPSSKQTRLFQIKYGEPVSVLSQNPNGWIQISVAGRKGWVFGKYLSSTSVETPQRVSRNETPKRTIAAPSSNEIRQAKSAIIDQSIASYPGSCPCPYNRDRGGRRCGKRSAWSRPGGYSPMCYESDVSESRLASYFARRRGAVN